MEQSLEKKGLVKKKTNVTLRTPLMGETFPHGKLTKLSAPILGLKGISREVTPTPSLQVFMAGLWNKIICKVPSKPNHHMSLLVSWLLLVLTRDKNYAYSMELDWWPAHAHTHTESFSKIPSV